MNIECQIELLYICLFILFCSLGRHFYWQDHFWIFSINLILYFREYEMRYSFMYRDLACHLKLQLCNRLVITYYSPLHALYSFIWLNFIYSCLVFSCWQDVCYLKGWIFICDLHNLKNAPIVELTGF